MDNRLFATRWVHAFEEDTAEGAVYRAARTASCRCRGGRGSGSSSRPTARRAIFVPGPRRSLRRAAGALARRRTALIVRRAREARHRAAHRRSIARPAGRADRRSGSAHRAWQGTSTMSRSSQGRQRRPKAAAPAMQLFDVSDRVALSGARAALSARPARAARSAAAHLHARSVGVRSASAASRRCSVPVREARAGPDRIALRGQQRRRAGRAARRGARSRRSAPAAVERPVADAGQRPLPPADGLRRLQPDLRGVQARARPRHRLGDHGRPPMARCGWSCGRSASTAPTPATAARPATCRSATSAPATRRPASRCKGGLICTALSHDIIAHETTHALLDGLRSSFIDPTNVDVPAFHEGFSDLVALFLHFTYADVVERAIRESRRHASRAARC